ncbi:MAG: sugar phosphate isomerase/epimerase [Candidatus Latescibacteria bacterium]|jgi:sugar phosphate isomerase/epimerase|nr:sugar phosphate isomerase/epimerase [Candidatus Latescibacterota bacterium]
MQLGIFSTVFERDTLEEKVDAVRDAGLVCVQFHMQCAGVEQMPEAIDEALCDRIRVAHESRGIAIGAVSGTFNMIHPDEAIREDGLRRLAVLAEACERMGASIITLCTGTRNTEWMWRPHPDNNTPEAWRDLVDSMAKVAEIAEANHVVMAFEPEVANTVDSAKKARQIIDEVGSDRIKVVIDGANIYHKGELAKMHDMLDEAFDLLAGDIVHAHAKDLDHDGEAGKLAAGTGVLDYEYYMKLLDKIGFDGPMVLHGLEESQVEMCRDFVVGKINR